MEKAFKRVNKGSALMSDKMARGLRMGMGAFAGLGAAAIGVDAVNFAFDVTPNRYVNAIITEKGIVRSPYRRTLSALLEAEVA